MPSSRICFRMFAACACIGPQHDCIHARIVDDSQLAREIGVARHELLLDDDGMAEAARGVAELDDAEPAVAIVDAQDGDALQARVPCRCGAQACSTARDRPEVGEVPGDDGFRNGGIGGGAVDDGNFARSATRSAMCVESPLIEPNMAQTLSS